MADNHARDETTREGGLSRRHFLGGAAAAAFSVVPARVLAGGGTSPSDKLNIAGVGLGAIGYENLEKCDTENIAALCDVDWRLAAEAFDRWPDASRYRDFRRMLDEEDDLDAVVVSTPDHTHAVVTAAAMKRGLDVYTEMPLAHNVREVRRLEQIARDTGAVTQMGNRQHSGPEVRRTCEWVWSGELGPVRRAECWTNRPTWPQGMGRPDTTPSAPDSLSWDLWLGPAAGRPYSPAYHPGNWKGWQDFGTGALGAMGCHIMDAAFWSLKLADGPSFTVEADSTGVNGETYPRASTVRYSFPARGDMPALTLTWRDGGRKPEPPAGWPAPRGDVGSNGSYLVGEDRTLIVGATTAGTLPGQAGPRVLPEDEMGGLDRPESRIPRVKDPQGWKADSRHQQEWIRACKKGEQPCASFDYAAQLSEVVLLGNVALRAGQEIRYDREAGEITNAPEANRYLSRDYREGWSL